MGLHVIRKRRKGVQARSIPVYVLLASREITVRRT